MPITRMFFAFPFTVGDALRISPEEMHHAYKVLRARRGDEIEAVDARGRLFVARLRDEGEAEVLEEWPTVADKGTVSLYQAVPKGRHMDLVVEKATELGVGRVVPLATERGVVKLVQGDSKLDRWRRVALAASRQSLRLRVPEVEEPAPFAQAARAVRGAGVILHNEPELPPLEEVVSEESFGLFVGPEGGWSEDELEYARSVGLRVASLGPFRLRSETAGIVAVARANAVMERVGGGVENVARSG